MCWANHILSQISISKQGIAISLFLYFTFHNGFWTIQTESLMNLMLPDIFDCDILWYGVSEKHYIGQ